MESVQKEKRGLYRWSKGVLNADLNGAIGIIRKVVPDSLNLILKIKEVCLATDVAKVFPDSGSVNEALRFLIRTTQENMSSFPVSTRNT